jgi:hypothetical protein
MARVRSLCELSAEHGQSPTEQVQSALASELAGLETRREKEKAAIWNEAT